MGGQYLGQVKHFHRFSFTFQARAIYFYSNYSAEVFIQYLIYTLKQTGHVLQILKIPYVEPPDRILCKSLGIMFYNMVLRSSFPLPKFPLNDALSRWPVCSQIWLLPSPAQSTLCRDPGPCLSMSHEQVSLIQLGLNLLFWVHNYILRISRSSFGINVFGFNYRFKNRRQSSFS